MSLWLRRGDGGSLRASFYSIMGHSNLRSLFSSKNLTHREKHCIALALVYSRGLRHLALPILERGLHRDKIPARFFVEVFLHLSLFLGFPAMLDGLEKLKVHHGVDERTRNRTPKRVSFQDGLKVFKKIYGKQADQVLKNIRDTHEEVAEWIIRDAYGKIFTRSGMSLRERELVNIVVLGVQGFAPQFFSHLRGALRTGVPQEGLQDLLVCISRYSQIETGSSMRKLFRIEQLRRSMQVR